MLKRIAYREREARGREEARKAREEAHWARAEDHWDRAEAHWARSHRITRFMFLCTVVTLACTVSSNDYVEKSAEYVSNAEWRAPASTKTTSVTTDTRQPKNASAEATNQPTTSAQQSSQFTNPVRQFASQALPDPAPIAITSSYLSGINSNASQYLSSPTLPNTGLINVAQLTSANSDASRYLANQTLTTNPIAISPLTGISNAGQYLASPTLPNTGLINIAQLTSINSDAGRYLANQTLTTNPIAISPLTGISNASQYLAGPTLTTNPITATGVNSTGIFQPGSRVLPNTDLITLPELTAPTTNPGLTFGPDGLPANPTKYCLRCL
jgi:hypothetical protein